MAVKLFDTGRLSSAQAADRADMPRVHFLYTWQQIQSLSGILLRPAAVTLHPLLSAQTALDEGHGAVILDDLKARRIALTLGLSVTGTLGILLQARQTGHLPSVSTAIATREKRGIWITPALSAKAIRLAGE